jgi:glycosyltransferase involved in cell wall biosynthesis
MSHSLSSPRVSVIMPVFNAARFLHASIASVRAQSLDDWELIAVDDGSSDESLSILHRVAASDSRIKVLTTGGNLGAGGARNRAMDAAQGRWLAFLDADDLWHPDKLDRQLTAMQQTGHAFSCTAYVRHDLEARQETIIGVPARATRADLLKTNTVACSTVMIDSEFFGPKRMQPLRRRQDFLFWLDLLTSTPDVLGLPVVFMTYSQHGKSLSSQKGKAAADTWTVYRNAMGLPLLPALWYFGNYALRGVLRHKAPRLARALGWLHSATLPT